MVQLAEKSVQLDDWNSRDMEGLVEGVFVQLDRVGLGVQSHEPVSSQFRNKSV